MYTVSYVVSNCSLLMKGQRRFFATKGKYKAIKERNNCQNKITFKAKFLTLLFLGESCVFSNESCNAFVS